MARREIRFGIVGGGLMGREFASAAGRWRALLDLDVAPRIVGVCDTSPAQLDWFRDAVPTLEVATQDYHDLLAEPDIEAIYCAVPHNLHERVYVDALHAGKHLFGEKPFGMDLPANDAILAVVRAHPELLVRCSSEFVFYPAAQQIARFIREGRFGTILDVQAGFLHSSDLDPNKPITWKRQAAINGAYGCMGDLGMHVLHLPLRAGWLPRNVRAVLSNIVPERAGADGRMVPCDTWDNATLFCEVEQAGGQRFPMTLETKRIAPGETNTWYLRIYGTALSAEFSTKRPKTLRTLAYAPGGPQLWQEQDLGSQSAYPTITGAIFEFGFSDAILQMWAAFCDELAHREGMRQPFICATPEETAQHHRVLTAALASQARGVTAALDGGEARHG
jgi:predicted dehydrogenase